MPNILIADSGATKTEWCLIQNGKRKSIVTQGLSPFFLNTSQIIEILNKELWVKQKNVAIDKVFFYGTGCSNAVNNKIVAQAFLAKYPKAKVTVDHDMMGAARSVCHTSKGVACILGTGSSACFYNGKTIAKSRTGLGYALGDEGSGSYLGRKIIQYYLYDTFDEGLKAAFEKKFEVSRKDILDNVYKKPFPQRYMASFTTFLSEHRGHYMIENILEDGLNAFFFTHLLKFRESWKHPIHFVGSISFYFKDVIKELCTNYGFTLGTIQKRPMDGLAKLYSK
jgi:N-acetylglucosamine kinase-like BadF-type ATPase